MTIIADRNIALPEVPEGLDEGMTDYLRNLQGNIEEYLRKMYDSLVLTDIFLSSDSAIYIGEFDVDGTWRLIRDGNDFAVQRRESGSYVEKFAFTA